ncbi:MAG: hypothetical protein NW237_04110 [Cyanobacteriota bacterium]|nr:hypothetical protein [Cyanobacteriota bacterium]
MYTIELVLKGNPAVLAVQQKEEAAANELYQKLTAALQKGDPAPLEITCDRTGKKVFVLGSELSAVQITPKAGSSSGAGARPGFLAQVEG